MLAAANTYHHLLYTRGSGTKDAGWLPEPFAQLVGHDPLSSDGEMSKEQRWSYHFVLCLLRIVCVDLNLVH